MKVVFVWDAYPPICGGGADFVRNLAVNLIDRKTEAAVVTTQDVASDYDDDLTCDGVRVLPVIDDWSLSNSSFRKMQQILSDLEPDVVHTVFPSARFGSHYHLPATIKLAANGPLITTLYGLGLLSGSVLSRLTAIALLHTSDLLASDNDFVMRIIERYMPYLRNRVRYLPSGSNISRGNVSMLSKEELRKKLDLERERFYASYFGYLAWDRGLENLFEAVRIEVNRGRDIGVIMIGTGLNTCPGRGDADYFFRLRSLIERLSLSSRVVWTEFCSEEEVASYFLASDVSVFPYRKNTLGRSSLPAALSFELPVVTTSPGGRDNVLSLRDHENVLLVPPDNSERLAEAIDELIQDEVLRKQLALAGFSLWKQVFSWPAITDRALGIYKEVAGKKK